MDYNFHFDVIWLNWDILTYGAWLTVRISFISMALGLLVGIVLAGLQTTRWKLFTVPIAAYIEIIRNTPFLVQLFFIYFGLPSIGFKLTSEQAALSAMVINLGAYATEIVRAGIESIHKEQIEAGLTLGFSKIQVFRHIILMPALKKVYPSLTSQFVLIMLGSSIISVISAEELTFQANYLQSRTFRSFEIYFAVTLIYLALTYLFRAIFGFIYSQSFNRRRLDIC
jgi:polar amino acid transport system permease protein